MAITGFETVVDSPKKKAGIVVQPTELDGVESLAAIQYMIDFLEDLKKEHCDDVVRPGALDIFVERGRNKKKHPGNFKVKENQAEGEVQLKNRASNRPLNEQEQADLKRLKVSFQEVNVFQIDGDLCDKAVLDVLRTLPKGVVTVKEQHITTQDSIDEAFRLDEAKCREALKIVSTLAVTKLKPNDGGEQDEQFRTAKDRVWKHLGWPQETGRKSKK